MSNFGNKPGDNVVPPEHAEALRKAGDGLPTMGEEAEASLNAATCTCGKPGTPGVVHRTDGPCYQDDWVSRIKLEVHDLDQKGMKLNQFIRSNPLYETLAPRDKELLITQMNAMSTYYAVLCERVFRAEHAELAKEADAAEAEANEKMRAEKRDVH